MAGGGADTVLWVRARGGQDKKLASRGQPGRQGGEKSGGGFARTGRSLREKMLSRFLRPPHHLHQDLLTRTNRVVRKRQRPRTLRFSPSQRFLRPALLDPLTQAALDFPGHVRGLVGYLDPSFTIGGEIDVNEGALRGGVV